MTRAMKKCITLLTVISLLMGVFLLPAAAVEDVNIDNDRTSEIKYGFRDLFII
jgi:hypothetical protein